MLSTFDLTTYAIAMVTIIVYGYAAYSAFAIGRTLSEGLYRRQALGIGLVSIIVAFLIVFVSLVPPSSSVLLPWFAFAAYYTTFIGTFYWIDTSVRAARYTDPLLRDTLHWKRLRLGFWANDIVATIFFLSYIIYNQLVFGGLNLQSPPPTPISVVIVSPLVIMFFSGVVVLPIASRRSKDRILRRHLDWFGVWAAVTFGLFFIVSGIAEVPAIVNSVGTAASGYFLYRSARSLVPLYTFPTETTSRN